MCLAILGLLPDYLYTIFELPIHNFLSTLAERLRTLLEPLFQLGQRKLTAYMNSRRQALLNILRVFHVQSCPPAHRMRLFMLNLAQYNLLEVPRAAVASTQLGFHSITGGHFMGVNTQMVSAWHNQQCQPIFNAMLARMQLDESDPARQSV